MKKIKKTTLTGVIAGFIMCFGFFCSDFAIQFLFNDGTLNLLNNILLLCVGLLCVTWSILILSSKEIITGNFAYRSIHSNHNHANFFTNPQASTSYFMGVDYADRIPPASQNNNVDAEQMRRLQEARTGTMSPEERIRWEREQEILREERRDRSQLDRIFAAEHRLQEMQLRQLQIQQMAMLYNPPIIITAQQNRVPNTLDQYYSRNISDTSNVVGFNNTGLYAADLKDIINKDKPKPKPEVIPPKKILNAISTLDLSD